MYLRFFPGLSVYGILCALALLAAPGVGRAQFGGAGTDVRVSDFFGHEAEVSIAVNPQDSLNQVLCGHATSPFETMNTFFTTDGGQTWTFVPIGQAEDGLPTSFRFDPTVAFADDGNVYIGYGAGSGSDRDLVVARSTDGGASYDQFTLVVVNDGSLDKWILNTGPDPATPGQSNVYIAYRQGSPPDTRLAASFDQGTTFPVDRRVNDGGSLNTFGMPASGPNGELYVVWDDQSNFPGSSTIRVDRSFDGGKTFGADVTVGTTAVTRDNPIRYNILAQPDRGVLAVPSIAVDRSGGPFEGRVYVAYTVVGGGGFHDTDVVLRFSDDLGATWSGEIPVHSPSTRSQFLPWLDVDQTNGMVAVVWLDARDDAQNKRVRATIGLSVDGGATFFEQVVADAPSDQSTDNGQRWSNNYLEYIGVSAHDGVAYAVWPDNSQDPANLDYFTDHLSFGVLLCQGQDSPDSDVLMVNGSTGPVVYVPSGGPHEFSILKPPAGGNGKFVVNLNAGPPSADTITPLPSSLGPGCFDFLIPPFGKGSPISIWNNLNREDKIGSSNYFGNAIADPPRASTVFHSRALGDPVNLPPGSQWTLQGVIVNPAASGNRPASATNPIHIVIR